MTKTINNDNKAFFYGTLMSTEIIGKVLCGKSSPHMIRTQKLSTLQLDPATLKGHKRFAVKHATYPGIIESDNINDQVNGILCQGLSLKDMEALDNYEGDEYERRLLNVTLKDHTIISCQVYIWIAGKNQLKDHDWNYQDWENRFIQDTEF